MEEILSLLLEGEESDSSGDREAYEGARAVATDIPAELLEPMPFEIESYTIREPTEDELAELKKKIRGKLASRKYSRRRKEESKAHAKVLRLRMKELEELREMEAHQQAAQAGPAPTDNENMRDEFALLFEQAKKSATSTLTLLRDVGDMNQIALWQQLGGRVASSAGSETICHVPSGVTTSVQLDWAFTNLRSIHDVLFRAQRDSPSTLSVSAFRGWQVAEPRHRGKRYCMKASKTLAGASVAVLGTLVWENADDPVKRIAVNTRHSYFGLSVGKDACSDTADPVFFSEEQHDFPIPFVSRRVASIHGTRTHDDDFVYVKHSIRDAGDRGDSIAATEIVGIVIRDAPSAAEMPIAHVDIVVAYDSHGVSHVQDLVCREPPLSHQVLAHWERHYSRQSVDR